MKIDMDIQILNDMVNRSIKAVDGLTRMYNYPSNISHLLYLIVPAFIVKYGISNERYILKSFEQIPILIQDKNDQIYTEFAYKQGVMVNYSLSSNPAMDSWCYDVIFKHNHLFYIAHRWDTN